MFQPNVVEVEISVERMFPPLLLLEENIWEKYFNTLSVNIVLDSHNTCGLLFLLHQFLSGEVFFESFLYETSVAVKLSLPGLLQQK